MISGDVLSHIWDLAGLDLEALAFANLTGADPVLPSSFAVGTTAQVGVAAAALAACELGYVRGVPRQQVSVDTTHASIDCTEWFAIDGKAPDLWDKFSGLYRTADGYVRVHANFAHHREGALQLLGLDPATATREAAEQAMLGWKSLDFEQAAAQRNLVVAALRSFDEWDATPQGQAIGVQPLFTLTRIGDAPPLELPALTEDALPLSGIRALDLTRILAGPVGGRALAAYGADVMLINSPNLPNIEAIANTSRGKLSALADLQTQEGRDTLWRLVDGAHVFSQGYRPGGLAELGFSPDAVAQRRPGIVYVSLTAYGTQGPWAGRRGFDSLVQTAMGFNHGEGEAAGDGKPRALPMQILDEATGYLMAFGAAAGMVRQQQEGGSWHMQVSLAQTGHGLRTLSRTPQGLMAPKPDFKPWLEKAASGFGELTSVRPSARLERTPAGFKRPSVLPGTNAPEWP